MLLSWLLLIIRIAYCASYHSFIAAASGIFVVAVPIVLWLVALKCNLVLLRVPSGGDGMSTRQVLAVAVILRLVVVLFQKCRPVISSVTLESGPEDNHGEVSKRFFADDCHCVTANSCCYLFLMMLTLLVLAIQHFALFLLFAVTTTPIVIFICLILRVDGTVRPLWRYSRLLLLGAIASIINPITIIHLLSDESGNRWSIKSLTFDWSQVCPINY